MEITSETDPGFITDFSCDMCGKIQTTWEAGPRCKLPFAAWVDALTQQVMRMYGRKARPCSTG